MSKKLQHSVAISDEFYGRVAAILEEARGNVVCAVNSNMVIAYWLIGREIVQELQGGEERAAYGKQVIEDLSRRLTERFGKGFSQENLQLFRRFYLAYSKRLSIPYPTGTELNAIQIPRLPGGEFADSAKLFPTGRELAPSPIPHPSGAELLQGSYPQHSWSLSRLLMRAVKRNIDRFPNDFMFVLTNKKVTDLRHHFGISSWVELV